MGGQYGVTKNGFVLKRYDRIYAELAEKIQKYAGIDITTNENSVLNLAFAYPFCDIASQLHEENLDVYNSLHPATAEGVALDDCCQFANLKRQPSSKTKYRISCNMVDGNTLKVGTIIAADTNPRHDLKCVVDTVVSREAFNEAYIKPVISEAGQAYTVTIDYVKHTYVSISSDPAEILSGIKSSLPSSYNLSIAEGVLGIKCMEVDEVHILGLSNNLTTESVTGIVEFETEEYGAISMPERTITMILSNLSTGFNWCENRIRPVLGRLEAEDWEYRQTYMERIYTHSSNMTDSIRSYLLNNVVGISAVEVYENDDDVPDADGRLPHSIEVVVEGGDDEAVAYGILSSKVGGISTNGAVSVVCIGANREEIEIRFNRPEKIYVWLRVEIRGTNISGDYAKVVKAMYMDAYKNLGPGETIILQEHTGDVYRELPGAEYVYVSRYCSGSPNAHPSAADYDQTNIKVKDKEIAVVSEDRIEVVVA